MTNNIKKLTLAFIALVAIVSFSALIVNNYKTKTSFKDVNSKKVAAINENPQDLVSSTVNTEAQTAGQDNIVTEADKLAILKPNNDDIIYGDKNAPITLIEYASLSCPHCSTFHRESFERLKTDYIDTKKVKFIHRDFPLNQPALSAAMVAICNSRNFQDNKSEKYYTFLKALFKTQDAWAFDEKYVEKLESIAKLDGMSGQSFSSCISDTRLQNQILESRMQAAKILKIQSTPTFFVNDEVLEGYIDYQTFQKAIDKQLSK
jgi:protein-disulfide isomerase